MKIFSVLARHFKSMSVSVPCSCTATAEAATIKDFSVTVIDTALQLNPLQWNRHIPEANLLMQHESLLMLERIHSNEMQFRYVLVKRGDVTVGVMYFQVVMFHANQLINYFPEGAESKWWLRTIKNISEKLLNLINVPLLVSGNVFMTGENGFYFLQDVDAETRAKIVRRTIREIVKENSQIKAALVSDLYAPKTAFDKDFKVCGFHEITVESDMSVTVQPSWKSFEDYLQSLSSKYRVRAKKVFSLTAEAGVTMKDLNAEEIKQHSPRLNDLYGRVMSKAEFKLAELSADFFYEQKKLMPDNYHLFGYFKEEQLVGFISAFQFGKRIEVHYTGMEHEISKPIHLYQRMMYDVLKLGIEKGVERLHFGRTAPEIKSTIGAVPSPMYGYVKHFSPVFNFLFVRNYTANLKPRHYIFRSPFK